MFQCLGLWHLKGFSVQETFYFSGLLLQVSLHTQADTFFLTGYEYNKMYFKVLKLEYKDFRAKKNVSTYF